MPCRQPNFFLFIVLALEHEYDRARACSMIKSKEQIAKSNSKRQLSHVGHAHNEITPCNKRDFIAVDCPASSLEVGTIDTLVSRMPWY